MNPITHTLVRFTSRLVATLGRSGGNDEPGRMPVLAPVVRIGYVGHLALDDAPRVDRAVGEILECIMTTARARQPGVALHAIGQLAPGADTLVARAALAKGYELHSVLPGSRAKVIEDVQGGLDDSVLSAECAASLAADRRETFESLLGRTSCVLELDAAPGDEGAGLREADYEQCAEVMLSRIDCLLALDHAAAVARPGGTLWTERRARSLGIPVIRIPIDRPGGFALAEAGSPDAQFAFDAEEGRPWRAAVSALASRIVSAAVAADFPFETGSFERRFLAQLDIGQNRRSWDARWAALGSVPSASMATARKSIDESIGPWAIWADHRASAMAELVRGAFTFCALMGLLAISCAVVGLILPAGSTPAKVVESICLLVILWFIARDRKMHWRDQWLFFRQLERRLDHAAWLMLVGRELKHEPAAEVRAFHRSHQADWMSTLSSAVIRAAGLPGLRLDREYLQAARDLVRNGLIRAQLAYCQAETALQQRADHLLERWIRGTFTIALTATLGYLAVKAALAAFASVAGAEWHERLFEGGAEDMWHRISMVVSLIGIGMPGIAAALASIRSHGDFAQLAIRYAGVASALTDAEQLLERLCPSGAGEDSSCTSRNIAAVALHVVSLLGHEATSWSAIIQTKEIEPS